MIMLSRLRRFMISDETGRQYHLVDISVALLDADYPPATFLWFHDNERRLCAIPSAAIQSIDIEAECIRTAGIENTVERDSLGDVLLERDILDALIIDLQHRRVTRANDLALEIVDGTLELRWAVVGLNAIIRRMTRGRLGRIAPERLYDWKYIEFLRGDPRAVKSGAGYHLRIKRLPAGEIARLTDPLPYLHAAELLTLLPDEIAADTLELMTPERQLQVFEELDDDQGIQLLQRMSPDLAADLIGRLDRDDALGHLNRMPRAQSERIVDLLRYSDETVGGIMTNEIVAMPLEMTVADAREILRESIEEPDFIQFLYIVSDTEANILCGVISLRAMIISDGDLRLEEIMNPYVVVLHPLESGKEAAYRVLNSGLGALPVVANDGRLLGAVTVDAAMAEVVPANWGIESPRIFS